MSEINLDESMSEILDELEKNTNDLDDDDNPGDPEPDNTPEPEPKEPEPAAGVETEPEPDPEPIAEPEIEPRLNVPPTTWTAEAKAQYNSLPAWAKKEVHKREEDVLRGIHNLKEQSQFGERISKQIQPYQALLNSKGLKPEDAVNAMLNTFYQLETSSPQQRALLIKDMMRRYETDMTVFSQQPDPNQDLILRAVAPLQQQVQYLQSQLQGQAQRSQQQQLEDAQREIQAFVTEVDEKGQPKYPYFANVSTVMSDLIEAGRATTLADAYDMAVWADPHIRSLKLAEQSRQEQAKKQEEARTRAASGKNANKLNLGKGGSFDSRQPKPTGSLADTMNEVYDAVASK